MPRLRAHKYKVVADDGPSKEVTGLNSAFAAIRRFIDDGYSEVATYRRTKEGWKLHRTDTSQGVGRVPKVTRPKESNPSLIGKWIPALAVKVNKNGTVSVKRKKK